MHALFEHARFENVAIDGALVIPAADVEEITPGGLSGEAPRGALSFQGRAGRIALGDVRVKLLENSFAYPDWQSQLAGAAQVAAGQTLPLGGTPLAEAFDLRATAAWTGTGGSLALSPDLSFPWSGGTGPAPKLGSLLAQPSAAPPVLADLVSEGVPFEFVLRSRSAGPGRVRLQVFVNGLPTASAELPYPPGGWRSCAVLARAGGTLRLSALDLRQVKE